jgi:hypothetical protein
MHTQYLHYIHPSTPFPHFLPPPTSTNPPRGSDPPSSHICKWKKKENWHFCLFKIATQGVSLWHFHVYMYYNQNWFISSTFLSTLVSFLQWFQQVSKLYTHSHTESTSTIFIFLTSFFYPPTLICDLPLAWPVFHNIAIFVLGLYSTYERKRDFWTFEPC